MSNLNPTPVAALRNLHYDAKSAAKVALIVQPGDTLTVSEDVADQLIASSSQFKDLDNPKVVKDDTIVSDVPVAPAKAPRKSKG
jgi:hypothetical protein